MFSGKMVAVTYPVVSQKHKDNSFQIGQHVKEKYVAAITAINEQVKAK